MAIIAQRDDILPSVVAAVLNLNDVVSDIGQVGARETTTARLFPKYSGGSIERTSLFPMRSPD
jgi:hypothetical protein